MLVDKVTRFSGLVKMSVDEKDKADIAVIGLAVMGQNLILNMLEKGFVVSWNFLFML